MTTCKYVACFMESEDFVALLKERHAAVDWLLSSGASSSGGADIVSNKLTLERERSNGLSASRRRMMHVLAQAISTS